jgi:hypothetical protein
MFKVLIVADRGFGDQKLYQVLTEELKFDYLIRFRGNIAVTSAEGETRPAADWVGVGGSGAFFAEQVLTLALWIIALSGRAGLRFPFPRLRARSCVPLLLATLGVCAFP